MSDAGGNAQPTRHSILRHHPGYPVWMLDDPMSDGPILLLSHRSRRLRPGPPGTQPSVPTETNPSIGTDRPAEVNRSMEADRSMETDRSTNTDRRMDGKEPIGGSDREDVIDLRKWIDRRNAMDPDRSTDARESTEGSR